MDFATYSRLADQIVALSKGKRLPGHVEKRDKRGRRYWGPPDTGSPAGTPHQALEAAEALHGESNDEAARTSARDNHNHALRLLIDHTPLDKLRQVAKEHGPILAATMREVVPHGAHNRLARKWRTPRTGATPNQRDGAVRRDNIRHLGIENENGEVKPGARFHLARALLDASEMPDNVRERVHGHIHAVHESLRDNRAVKPRARKRAEAQPTGTHIEQAHGHIDRAVQVLRDGGHHEHAEALEKVKGRMGKKPRAKAHPMTEEHVEGLRAQHNSAADDHDREAAVAHEKGDKEAAQAHRAAADAQREAAQHLDARQNHKASAKRVGDTPESDEALSNPRHRIWEPYRSAARSADRASKSARAGKAVERRGLQSAIVARPGGND